LAEVGLLADLSNAADIIPRFIAAWKKTHDDEGFMHEYVSFVELAVEKKQVEQKLDELRPAANVAPEPELDVDTVTLAQPAMSATPATPRQNKQKTLIEEEGSRHEDLQEDEDEHDENTGEDDDEEVTVEEAKRREEE
jgi:hypothetical protein